MNWFEHVDGYCERLAPGLWAEPVNAVTNLGFVLVALWLWRSRTDRPDRALVAILLAIGLGSAAFHTFANPLTGLMDVLPIAAFVFTYIALAVRDYLRLRGIAAIGAYAASVGLMLSSGMVLGRAVPALGASAAYLGVAVVIWAYALFLAVMRERGLATGLAIGAGLLTLSIFFRALDGPVCTSLPLGTHFLWHLLNAAMLGWMIVVRRRHLLAASQGQG